MSSTQPAGYLALPPNSAGPGILVLHAWWGLNDTMRAFCDRLAAAGFVAFAPDLYHGKVADTIEAAEALGGALDANHLQVKAEITAATTYLRQQAQQADGVAVIGFSLGACYALHLATAVSEHIDAVVLFYGTGPADHSQSNATYLGHFAANDEYEPQANVDALEDALTQAGRPVTFTHTGHWFCEPDRPQAYNQAAAVLAWERTLAFLQHAAEKR